MGGIELIMVLVFVFAVGRIITRRQAAPLPRESLQLDAEELHRVRDTIADLSTRMERLEEERDFYKDLLEPPRGRATLPPPDSES